MSRRAVVSGDELQFVVFRLGEQDLAIGIIQVERILRYEPPEAWSDGPGFLAGRMDYHGARVPVMDLRSRTGQRPVFHEETRTMVLALEPAPLAVVVDQVKAVLRVDSRTIRPPEGQLSAALTGAVSGTIAQTDRSILVLNAARLLTAEEWLALSEALT